VEHVEGSLQQAKTQLDSCSHFNTIGLPACDGRTDGRTDDKSTATTTANTALAWRRAVEKEEENEHRWAFTEPLSARDTAKK